ncbi:MAG: hypothetical protein ACKVTZ_13790 [Bacteroidia bacterium]
MKKYIWISVLTLSFVAFSCSKEGLKKSDLEEKDLVTYGIPVKVNVPKGATIEKDTLALEQNAVKISYNQFQVKVEMLREYADPTFNADSVGKKRLDKEKHRGSFGDLAQNDGKGFVFETEDKTRGNCYHFFHNITQDSFQIEITDYLSLANCFTETEATFMYEAMKSSIYH